MLEVPRPNWGPMLQGVGNKVVLQKQEYIRLIDKLTGPLAGAFFGLRALHRRQRATSKSLRFVVAILAFSMLRRCLLRFSISMFQRAAKSNMFMGWEGF